jgi:hypothetical protein
MPGMYYHSQITKPLGYLGQIQIRTGHLKSLSKQYFRDPAHPNPADADKMYFPEFPE